MTWFRVDDSFHSHPKALKAGNAALGLWVRCASWSSAHLRDGFVSEEIARLYAARNQIESLIKADLWERVDGGYQMHDFGMRNPSAEAVRADRSAAAERQKRARDKARERRIEEEESRVSHGVTHGVTHALVTPVVTVPPTRPVPKEKELQPPSVSAGAVAPAAPMTITQRSKRITDAYAAVEPMCKWVAVNGIVIKAVKADKWTDLEIRDALLRMAGENRSVTIDSLRTELAGLPPMRVVAGRGRSDPTNDANRQYEAAMARAQAQEASQGQQRAAFHDQQTIIGELA
jgi:hypothetical protein